MELSFGPEYEEFREDVRKFVKQYGDRSPKAGAGVSAGQAGQILRDWQKLLIENGYAARTIPKEYGGFGAEPDILKAVIIDEELNAGRVVARDRRPGAGDARADASRDRLRGAKTALDPTDASRRVGLVPGVFGARVREVI